jgi:hypothetical protein
MLTLWQIFVIILLVILLVLSAILIAISSKNINNITGGDDGGRIAQLPNIHQSTIFDDQGGILYNPEDDDIQQNNIDIGPNNIGIGPNNIGIGPIAAQQLAAQQLAAQQLAAQQLPAQTREAVNIITELYNATRYQDAIFDQSFIDEINMLYNEANLINDMIENNSLNPGFANSFNELVMEANSRYNTFTRE